MNLRISDIGDIRIIGKANTIHKQLREIAAHHSFINQSEEATPTELSSHSGGASVPCGPAIQYQDIDASREDYRAGISRSAI